LADGLPEVYQQTVGPPLKEGPMELTVKITPDDRNTVPGKVADAELHFSDGPLAGLKLIGFAVWERRSGGGLNVTFPARQYSINGERRSFAILRPVSDATSQQAIRDLIIDACRNVAAQQEGR
jgi:hypothetical protein